MFSSTFKLHGVASPTAFDINLEREELFVGNSTGVCRFSTSDLSTGRPRQVALYEQPQSVRKITCRQAERVCVLRGGAVALWDPANLLRPLRASLPLPKGSPIADFQEWDRSALLACNDAGELVVYDFRAQGAAAGVRVCGGLLRGGGVRMQLSGDGEGPTLSVASPTLLSLLDVRYLGRDDAVATIDFSARGLLQHCWCDEGTLAAATGDGMVSFWDAASRANLSGYHAVSGKTPLSLLSIPSRRSVLVACAAEGRTPSVRLSLLRVPGLDGDGCTVTDMAVLRDALLGMALGSPGQLIPPYASGAEVLLLSPSAVLHAVKVPEGALPPSRPAPRPPAPSASPRFPVKELRRDMSKSESASSFSGEGRGEDCFLGALRAEVLQLQGRIEAGQLGWLSVGSVDPYAKQVTLVMVVPPMGAEEPSTYRRPAALEASDESVFSLIVSFPAKYPTEGLPTFTLRQARSRGRGGPGIDVEAQTVVLELLDIAKRLAPGRREAADDASLLVEVARCFRWRVMQLVLGRPENADDETLLTLSPAAFHSGAESETLDAVLLRADLGALQREVVEAKSYGIPCPCTSGAMFSAGGMLLCFGASALDLHPARAKPPAEDSLVPYPRSYADMLLILREEDDQDGGSVDLSSYAATDDLDLAASLPYRKKSVSLSAGYKRGDSAGLLGEFARFDDESPLISSLQLEARLRGRDDWLDEAFDLKSLSSSGSFAKRASYERLDDLGPGRRLSHEDSSTSTKNAARSATRRRISGNLGLFAEGMPAAELVPSRAPGKGFSSSVMTSTDPRRIEMFRLKFTGFLELANQYTLPHCEAAAATSAHMLSSRTVLRLPAGDGAQENLLRADMCRHNADVARSHGKANVAQVWALFAVSFEALVSRVAEDCLNCWEESTIGRPLMQRLFRLLQQANDVQALACLLAICGPTALAVGIEQTEINRVLFAYAYALQSLGANLEACLIFKFIPERDYRAAFREMEFDFALGIEEAGGAAIGLQCSVCQDSVKSLSVHCPDCGHGGHPAHIRSWFARYGDCPTGCGCICGTKFAFEEDEDDARSALLRS